MRQKRWLDGRSSTSSSTETFTDDATTESSYDAYLRSKAGYYCKIYMKAHAQVMLDQDHWQKRFFVRVSIGRRYFKT